LEGLHLVEEALRSGIEVQTIFVRTGSEPVLDSLDRGQLAHVPEILSVPEEVLRSAVTTEAPQGIAALAVAPVFTLERLFGLGLTPLLLVLAGVQDPGNVGTILRSAEAFGAHGVLALPGTANVWNAKSLRASMGSAFRLPVIAVDTEEAFKILRAHGVPSLAAVAPGQAGARVLGSHDLRGSVALWIGNEGSGLTPEVVAACEATVTIPCPGPVESLNAAVAASVLLYEVSRQRGHSSQKAHPSPA
jgi:TrmH family RNA methyltransferase